MTLAYTYREAEETGGDLFNPDYPLTFDYPRHSHGGRRTPSRGDDRSCRAASRLNCWSRDGACSSARVTASR